MKLSPSIIKLLAFLLVPITFGGCLGESVPDGRILVKNDCRDRKYNVIQVSGGGAYYTLEPGETALLPKGANSISFSRQYADHVKRYMVQCPRILDSGIVIKLIDVHVNRIAGGCTTVSYSR
jgi:hypothetical protein